MTATDESTYSKNLIRYPGWNRWNFKVRRGRETKIFREMMENKIQQNHNFFNDFI